MQTHTHMFVYMHIYVGSAEPACSSHPPAMINIECPDCAPGKAATSPIPRSGFRSWAEMG